MTDILSKEQRRRTMQSIRSKNTAMEKKVSRELWKRGFRFRKNVKSLKGTPDIAIKKYKIVVFLDSCFWHGCKEHCRYPRSNKDYWYKKIANNVHRDNEITQYYINNNWNIVRLWEHDLNNNFDDSIKIIESIVMKYKNKTKHSISS